MPVLGSFLDAQKHPLQLFSRSVAEYGPTVRFRFGPYDFVLLNRPEDIHHVFVENHGNYRKSPSYKLLRRVLGDGLLTSEGTFWRRQRKLAQPAFHHKRLIGFAKTMADLSEQTSAGLATEARPVDMHALLTRLTLRIVGHTLMSTELDHSANRLSGALEVLLKQAQSTEAFLFLPSWVPTVGGYRLRKATVVLDDIIQSMIDERRGSDNPPEDLLSMLLEATDETGAERMTDRQLRDELLTLVLAGHETTANALSWTLMLLARHPSAQRRAAAEIRDAIGDGPVAFSHLEQLPYTEAVLKESMRLYPPAWIFEREALGPDVVDGYSIDTGWLVAASPWTLHRDPSLYPKPTAFDPDRFLPEQAARRSRYAYIPFGLGPRVCIGNSFAMMEAKIVLATLLRSHHFEPADDAAITPNPGITLRPTGVVRLLVSKRPIL